MVEERIREGQDLVDRAIPDMAELGALDAAEERWHTRTVMQLRRYLPGPELLAPYLAPLPVGRPVYRPDAVDPFVLATGLAYRHAVLEHRLARLRAIGATLDHVATTVAESGPAADLDFAVVRDLDRRAVARADYAEAARAHQAGAWVAASIMAAGALEVVLLDALERPEVSGSLVGAAAPGATPQTHVGLEPGGATLAVLLETAVRIRVVDAAVADRLRLAGDPRSALIARTTRAGDRPGQPEAELFLRAVALVHRALLDWPRAS